MSNEVIKLIKKNPLFYELTEKEIESIISDCNVHQFHKDSLILSAGAKNPNLTIILDGETYLTRRDGTRVNLKAGSLFGELNLLSDSIVATNIFASSETVSVLEVPFEKIHEFYASNMRTYAILMANLAKMLAKRLQRS